MKVKEFYQTYLDIKNPFSHQLQFFHLALSNKFPILVKAPTGSGKTEKKIWERANKIFPEKFLKRLKIALIAHSQEKNLSLEEVFKTAYWLKMKLRRFLSIKIAI